jgi:hypothetical protein
MVFVLWAQQADSRSDIPFGAVTVAQQWLDKQVEGTGEIPEPCTFDASRCRLGTPYMTYRMADNELEEFVDGGGALMEYVNVGPYAFPVIESGGQVRTIYIARVPDDPRETYLFQGFGSSEACGDAERVERLRHRLPGSGGYQIDTLRIFGVGRYFIVRSSDGRASLSPMDYYSAKVIGVTYGDDSLVAMEDAVPLIRVEARARLLRESEKRNRSN